jgi:hypothetical protein
MSGEHIGYRDVKKGLMVRRGGSPKTPQGRARKAETFKVTEVYGKPGNGFCKARLEGHSRGEVGEGMSTKRTRHDAQRALDIEQARKRKAEIRERTKATALRMLEAGRCVADVMREAHVDRKTVRKWAQEAGLSTERRPLQEVTTGTEAEDPFNGWRTRGVRAPSEKDGGGR